jgi:hypothetical protein
LRPRHCVLVRLHDLAHVLGVEPRRQLSRTDQIAEHHRQLPPFSMGSQGSGSGALAGPASCVNRLEQALAVAEVEPELFQIGVGEFGQDVAGNTILCEHLRMVSEPLFSEPARDVDHPSLKPSLSRTVAQPFGCDCSFDAHALGLLRSLGVNAGSQFAITNVLSAAPH